MAETVENLSVHIGAALQEQEALPDFLQELEAEMQTFIEQTGLNSDTPEALTDRELLIDYYMEKIQALDLRAGMNHEIRNRRVRVEDDWLEDENRKLRSQVEWLEQKILLNMPGTLGAFQDTFGVTTKSRKLPHGQVGFKSSQDSVDIQDQTKAVIWAKANDVDVKVETTLLKTPAKKYVMETGDEPDLERDGLTFVPGAERRYVTVNAD